jgi:hypothetical protein
MNNSLVLAAAIASALALSSGCQKKAGKTYPPASMLSALNAITEEVGTSANDVVTFARLYDQGPPAGEIWKIHLATDWTERCRVTRRFGALLVESSRHLELEPWKSQLDEPVRAVWASVETLCDGQSTGPLPHKRTLGAQGLLKGKLEALSGRLKELAPPRDGGAR